MSNENKKEITIDGVVYVVERKANGIYETYPKGSDELPPFATIDKQEPSQIDPTLASIKADVELLKALAVKKAIPTEVPPDMPPLPELPLIPSV